MAIKQMYDIIETGYNFTGIQRTNVSSDAVDLPIRLFYEDGISISHDGGDTLTPSDYSLVGLDQPLTNLFGKNVYTKLYITNVTYQTGTLTLDFVGVGDMMLASDMQELQDGIDSKFDPLVGGPIEANITVRNIMPNMIGGANGVSTRDIGSPTAKFNAVYADEVFVGASSLYVNGKKVVEDVSDTMTFQTDEDQGLTVKTTSSVPGSGNANIVIQSGNQVDVVGQGGIDITVPSGVSNKNIVISNASNLGQIQISTADDISITAAQINLTGATQADDLIVNGDLTVQGTTTTLNTQTLTIEDNILEINTTQVGVPADSLVSGITVNRGDSPDYRFVFEESSDTFRVGESGTEQAVATRQDAPANGGIAYWNPTARRLDTTPTFKYDGGNLNVPGNVEITGTGWAIFPNRTGLGRVPNHADGSTLQVSGGALIGGGLKLLNGLGTVTTAWYASGPEDINIMRNYNNIATLLELRSQVGSPIADDREATLALTRTDDAGNEEFFDLFNNGYHSNGNVEHGIRIQKRGSGQYRDFAIQFSDGTTVEDAMRITPAGDVTIKSRRVVTVSSGTAFPAEAGLGDEVYRTDLDEWYKYNGSVWTQI